MSPTWILLLSLYANPQPSLQIPEPQRSAPDAHVETHALPKPDQKPTNVSPKDDKGNYHLAPMAPATINFTMLPPDDKVARVTKMTGVEADTRVYVPSAVQVPFPSKDGCEAAAKAAEKVGKGVCLEIR